MTANEPLVVTGVLAQPGQVRAGTVVVRDGILQEVTGSTPRTPGIRWSGYVLPGLVDIHAHGAAGHSFNDSGAGAWRTVLDAHLRHGTTATLATVATGPWLQICEAVDRGAALLAEGVAALAGVHLEGPYLAASHRGAHPAQLLRQPSDGLWRALATSAGAGGALRMVTLAPELPGAGDAVAGLAAAGVTVSAGHTAATAAQLEAAVAGGVRHVAHLWSGHTELRRHGPVREPGLLEAVLGSAGGEVTAELIADGHHVTAEMARLAYRCLGPERLCLVSDASPGAGLAVGADFAMGGVRGTVAEGVALAADGRSFCGSTSFLSDVLRFAVVSCGIPLPDAVRMAGVTPALAAGLDDGHRGRLGAGGPANLLLLDRHLRVGGVMHAGRWIVPPALVDEDRP